ncbi:hypothetical protein ACT6QG_11650 [Xanthobacter sp. TB0136]|uniref:hypothetical protein n=1 Tax=Xanthobacter sp. TB0136 TaxID=3459177 RepID=UPI004039ED3C
MTAASPRTRITHALHPLGAACLIGAHRLVECGSFPGQVAAPCMADITQPAREGRS